MPHTHSALCHVAPSGNGAVSVENVLGSNSSIAGNRWIHAYITVVPYYRKKEFPVRVKTRARCQTSVRQLRRQVLRSAQGPDCLSEMRECVRPARARPDPAASAGAPMARARREGGNAAA